MILLVPATRSHSIQVCLILSAGVTLHLAHIPYWFSGILGFHYAFESMIIWILLVACAVSRLLKASISDGRLLMIPWTVLFLGTSAVGNFSDSVMGAGRSRLSTGVRNFSGMAERYETFREGMSRAILETPALVLLKTSPADLHVEHIRYDPSFQGSILYGRWNGDRYSVDDIRRLYPDRHLYLYSTVDRQLEQIAPGAVPPDAVPPDAVPPGGIPPRTVSP